MSESAPYFLYKSTHEHLHIARRLTPWTPFLAAPAVPEDWMGSLAEQLEARERECLPFIPWETTVSESLP